MGCFWCFDSKEELLRENNSKEEEKLNPSLNRGQRKEIHPHVLSNMSKLSSGIDRLKTRNNGGLRNLSMAQKDMPNIAAQTFTFREVAAATKNFRPESFLGEGGFGRVYKGRLESTGQASVFQAVAVKQLDKDGHQGNREFLVEVLMLSLLHHDNLVNLIGYCADGDQRLLVYEYMPLGSLEDHLLDLPPDKEPLDWNTRIKIAADAAKGLEYLHDKASPPVIYRDFKSSNILLDEGFHAKLSDFGLAKLGPTGDQSHVSTRVMGTFGYCAPEYAMTGQLTVKSDVYSFGVVFLELITGRRAIDSTQQRGVQNLVQWARPLFNDRKKHVKLIDPRLNGQYPMRGLYQALSVASMCIQEEAAARPHIRDVVTALSFLANQSFDLSSAPGHIRTLSGDKDEKTTNDEGGGRILKNEKGGRSGHKWESDGTERDDSPTKNAKVTTRDLDRERAVAEAKMWGENWRDKGRLIAEESFNGTNG
ncbi:hypothetical protein RHMOL_Rhmol12G0024700 [Rhododendron molle]|uniref:Uncharacterized protein n=1 Tax=Rhododendron molle TaxID=49168 RepID=A0ACC0LDI5_RHOML|nr:hypothetical protein RHMOL_Rhmol12G0024700 [Rhododendron molle]